LTDKHLVFAGQSNADPSQFPDPPVSPTTFLFRESHPSTTLAVAWAPSDPNGWWASLAASQIAENLPTNGMVWNQWESDTLDATYAANYGANLQQAVLDHDARVGHSNTFWAVVRANPNAFAYDSGRIATIQAGQDAAEAAMPTRIKVINTDDLLPSPDGAHYPPDVDQLLWARCKAAIATHFGDPTWL